MKSETADIIESSRLDVRSAEAFWRKTQRQCATHFASRLSTDETKRTTDALRARVAATVESVGELSHDMTLLRQAFKDLEEKGEDMGAEVAERNNSIMRELQLRNERVEREFELIAAQQSEADALLEEQRKLSAVSAKFCGKCSITDAWWCGDRCTCAVGILVLQLLFFVCAILALIRWLQVF